MLQVNPETVCEIILKAREFQAKDAMSLPESASNPADDKAMDVLADRPDDLTYQEVQIAIKDLEPDQQVELVALMWLGRGDFDAEEWDSCRTEAEDRWTPRAAEYLLSTPLVADYLREGLGLLGYACEE
ncbi:MAG: DUF3775 domain-containing protein [Aquisalimonadaceae bacterium]